MTSTSDKQFQKALARDCTEELLQVQNPKGEDFKLFEDILKKYEDKIYERNSHKIPVNTIEDKRIKEDFSQTGMRQGFGQFGAQQGQGFNLQGGIHGGAGFNPHGGMHGGGGFPNPFGEHRNYGDPQANSKYYYPEDFHQNNPGFQNKPVDNQLRNQIPNVGIPDPFGGPNFFGQNQFPPHPGMQPGFPGNQPGFHGNQPGLHGNGPIFLGPHDNFGKPGGIGAGQHGMPNLPGVPNLPGFPLGFNDDQMILRRNVEMIGGIERTIPNMERSLQDYEFKALEQHLRSPPRKNQGYNQFNTPNQFNAGLNQFNQSMPNLGVGGMFSPPFDPVNIRGASPLRGTPGPQNLSRSFYASPDNRGGYQGDFDQRQNNFARVQNAYPEIVKKEVRINFPDFKDLRQQKADMLGFKFNIPQGRDDDY